MGQAEDADEGGKRLGEGNFHGIAIDCLDPFKFLGYASLELSRSLDLIKNQLLGEPTAGSSRRDKRVHDIVSDHFSTIVELHTLPEVERPCRGRPLKQTRIGQGRASH